MTMYRVVEASDPTELATHVDSFLLRGWELQGGVTATVFTNSDGAAYYSLFQAMVKVDL